jgi:hypothetical protein
MKLLNASLSLCIYWAYSISTVCGDGFETCAVENHIGLVRWISHNFDRRDSIKKAVAKASLMRRFMNQHAIPIAHHWCENCGGVAFSGMEAIEQRKICLRCDC